MAKKVTEIRRRVLEDDQVFECDLFFGQTDYLILRYVNSEPQRVGDTTIPAGSITLAHYRQNEPAVWWEMYYPSVDPIGDLIHLASPVDVQENEVIYTDLLLDIWRVAGEPPRLLDEDELAEAVATGALTDAEGEDIRRIAAQIMADIPGHAPPLWHSLDPASESSD